MKKLILITLAFVVAAGLFVLQRSKMNDGPSPLEAEPEAENSVPGTPSGESASHSEKDDGSGPGSFKTTAERAWTAIPTLADLQKLPNDELHHTPKAIQEAALALGDLAQMIHDNPAYRRDGFVFYEKCTREDKFPASVRAICLRGFRKLGAELGERMDESHLPPQIRRLTDRLEN